MNRIIPVILTFILFFAVAYHYSNTKSLDVVLNTYNATCTVGIGDEEGLFVAPLGTGIILDTGYILTARHVVDLDRDGILSNDERDCVIRFRYGEVYDAKVLCIGKKDFALLECTSIRFKMIGYPYTKAAKRDPMLGEKVHTVGAMSGRNLHVSDGRISIPELGRGRTSCFISRGNSGGGLISENNEHLGIVVAVGLENVFDSSTFFIKIQDKTFLGKTSIHRRVEVNTLCYYESIDQIRTELNRKGLAFLIDKDPERSFVDKNSHLIGPLFKMFANLFIFLGFVLYVRQYLFS